MVAILHTRNRIRYLYLLLFFTTEQAFVYLHCHTESFGYSRVCKPYATHSASVDIALLSPCRLQSRVHQAITR
jgi:hypothetical protein